MRLMSGVRYYTVEELAAELNTSYRSIYRYIDTFKTVGFAVEKVSANIYRLLELPEEDICLKNLLYFSEEEGQVISNWVESMDGTSSFKANIYKKLAFIYQLAEISSFEGSKSNANARLALSDAIENHKRVILKNYSSPNSGTVKDRHVEPFAFTNNFIEVWAYDCDVEDVRIFKIPRIQKVEVLDESWENETKHIKSDIDAFHMSGKRNIHVRFEMDQLAYNLLCEEYPLAVSDICQEENKWIYDSSVCKLEGVGRFVIGLLHNIRIVDSPELANYVDNYIETYKKYK